MNPTPTNLIYLLGAGRSGTTMLTTVLNNHPKIVAIGEMHQFLDYVQLNKDCSCGDVLDQCPFWSPILKGMDVAYLKRKEIVDLSNALEWHSHIPKHLLQKNPNETYSKVVHMIFEAIDKNMETPWLLDSSKYISRYLLLKKNPKLNVKGIYMVRDVRGVIHSFGKQVQTPKSPLSAILYYTVINFWGQLVSSLQKNVLQIRYEDFVSDPEKVMKKIELHVFGTITALEIEEDTSFTIPHIIAGNRLRSQGKLVIKKDIAWKQKMSRGKQIFYYLLALPTMVINRYKI